MSAAFNGFTDVVEYLVDEHHINVEQQCDEGMTPIMYAVCNDNQSSVEYLYEKAHANVNVVNKVMTLCFVCSKICSSCCYIEWNDCRNVCSSSKKLRNTAIFSGVLWCGYSSSQSGIEHSFVLSVNKST